MAPAAGGVGGRDRDHGQGLPSSISTAGYARLRAAVERRGLERRVAAGQRRTASLEVGAGDLEAAPAPAAPQYEGRRFASLADVSRAGFRRVAQGQYVESAVGAGPGARVAHPVWELRGAEDGNGGCVLVRRREERAVDLRTAGGGLGTEAAVAAGIVRQARLQRVAVPSFWTVPGPGGTFEWQSAEPVCPACGKERPWHSSQGRRVIKPCQCGSDPMAQQQQPQQPQQRARPQQQPQQAQAGLQRRAKGARFCVSLLQVPGGDLAARRVLLSEQEMDADELARLVGELGLSGATLAHDTWTDGEWELRVRGPSGELIHEYDATEPGEIGGEKGRSLLDQLGAILSGGGGGGEEGAAPGGGEPGAEELGALLEPGAGEGEGEEGAALPLEAPPPEAGGMALPPAAPAAPGAPPPAAPGAVPLPPPPAAPGAPLAPTSAALRRGVRARVVRQGAVADCVIVLCRPEREALDVLFADGAQESLPMGALVGLEVGGGGGSGGGSGGGGGDEGDFVDIGGDELDLDLGGGDGGDGGGEPFNVELGDASETEPEQYEGDDSDEDDGMDRQAYEWYDVRHKLVPALGGALLGGALMAGGMSGLRGPPSAGAGMTTPAPITAPAKAPGKRGPAKAPGKGGVDAQEAAWYNGMSVGQRGNPEGTTGARLYPQDPGLAKQFDEGLAAGTAQGARDVRTQHTVEHGQGAQHPPNTTWNADQGYVPRAH